MTATKLSTIRVEKPWGRRALGAGFADVPPESDKIGEIWFDAPPGADHELMVKYLFTSERLSIQVHPNDDQARERGYPRGKEECWIILDAEPDSSIAMGTVRPVTQDALRAAALDGSIEQLVDWKPVKAGDIVYLPAGTVHAIGAGITLIEIQQNVDLTYRLYDYGRPRELHLDDGIAVSKPEPFEIDARIMPLAGDRISLTQGGKFVVEQWNWSGDQRLILPDGVAGWFVPVSGSGLIDGARWQGGECWHVSGEVIVSLAPESDILFAYAGPQPLPIFPGT